MAAAQSFVKITALPPVPKGFTGDPEIWRFMEALRQRVGGDSGDLIYNAAFDASQSAASLEPLVYAVAQEVQTSLEGQIRAIIEDAQVDRIDTASADNNVTPLPNPEQPSFDDFPIGALLQQSIEVAPVQTVFGRKGNVVATEGDYSLDQLSDVTLTAPSSNQVLTYTGTEWVNSTPVGAETGPEFTYSAGELTQIDYDSGNYKLFSYSSGALSRVDYVVGATTYRDDFTYNMDGTLAEITRTVF